MVNEFQGDEVYTSEQRESWVKLASPIEVVLEDGSKMSVQLFKLVQVVKLLKSDNSVVQIIHKELQPQLNTDAAGIKAHLDGMATEKQEEIDKALADKLKVDEATPIALKAKA